ncbi:MAG: 3-isopropylmalate dehydratase small subunit [Oscillospiraceae bacterium]|jgi:3-isopropylmalate/(R)-2-methylmalate dehydratase small subunit|nr:3-isopropylmalate dehydratase small subunit [Oscillospiraceae bacterium]
MNVLQAKALAKFGDNISTDDMTPGKYLESHVPADLGKICMRELDPDFPKKMAQGGFVVGGMNFGCGSSRETAPIALKACNVKGILAGEYARIFYRNCINIGIPVMECPDYDKIDVGDELRVNFETGKVENITKNETYQSTPIPEFLMDKINAGGLLEILEKMLGEQRG